MLARAQWVLYGIVLIGVRGSHERVISSLRAFGPGGGQIWRVVRVSARAPFEVLPEKVVLLNVFRDFAQDVQRSCPGRLAQKICKILKMGSPKAAKLPGMVDSKTKKSENGFAPGSEAAPGRLNQKMKLYCFQILLAIQKIY